MAQREENLVKNTIIFAIGTFGSKLIQFILVPFYTRVLNSSEFGTVDLLQSVVQLLIPIVALSIYESVFRYAMEKDYDKTAVLTTGVVICVAGIAVMCALGPIAAMYTSPTYVWLVIANSAVNALWTIYSQYTRAIGRSTLFAVDNILMTFLVLVLNVVFLAVFKWGINGYMLGYTLANAIATLFLIVCLKGQCKLDFKKVNKKLTKEMLVFAFPLILNGICWWLSGFANRVIIVSILGTTENGIFAAANKIPSLIYVVMSIFMQAWQMSANEEFKNKDIAQFYTNIHEQLNTCLIVFSSLLILFCKPINDVFLGEDFSEAWVYMPPLILSMIYFSLSSFLISIYSANKETKMAFVTNIVSVIINIALNFVLIPIMGIMGASIATLISYFVLWIVRVFDTSKIVKIKYNIPIIVASNLIVILQTIFICLDLDTIITYSACSLGTIVLVIIHWKTLISLVKFFMAFVMKFLSKFKKQ